MPDVINCSYDGPESVQAGETRSVALNVTVENAEDVPHTLTVAGYVGDEQFQERSFTMDPGTQDLRLAGPAAFPDVGADQSVEVGAEVVSESAEPVSLSIVDTRVTRPQSDRVRFFVDVQNPGPTAQQGSLEFLVDGESSGSLTRTVGAGETVTFRDTNQIIRYDAGDHRASVRLTSDTWDQPEGTEVGVGTFTVSTRDGIGGGTGGGGTGGGGTGGGGTGGTPPDDGTSIDGDPADLSISGGVGVTSIDENDTLTVSITTTNNGNRTVLGGFTFENGSNLRRLEPGESFTSRQTVGPFSPGQVTFTARPAVGNFEEGVTATGSRVTLDTITVTREDEPDRGGEDGSGGGTDTGPGNCPDGQQWSDSIGECIPSCPDGQFYVPGDGCTGVSVGSFSPEASVYGGAQRAVLYAGARPGEDDESRTDENRRRRRSGSR